MNLRLKNNLLVVPLILLDKSSIDSTAALIGMVAVVFAAIILFVVAYVKTRKVLKDNK